MIPHTEREAGVPHRHHFLVVLLLAAYVVIGYWGALTLPFINDDYFFLDKIRQASFFDLWKPERLYFQWYRPWSRELHYWFLSRLFGHREVAYHAISFGLWLTVAVLYFRLVERLSGERFTSAVALTGMAALTLWAGPLFWVAGVQDLWMVLFGLLFLHAVVAGRHLLASLPLALALLSKETAAVLPAIGAAYLRLVARQSWSSAFRRSSGHWVLLACWGLLHPTLRTRLFTPGREFIETAYRPSWPEALTRTVLSQVNLDQWPWPETGWPRALLIGALTAVVLLALLFVASRRAPSKTTLARESQVLRFGAVWAILGWAVLLLPSIGWHPYYGVLGTLGCWVVIGVVLTRHRKAGVAVVACLALLRAARADTPSWDWGTDWYQYRAGSLLGAIRERLFHYHTTLRPRSRLFFARLPNNIGLLAGDGPAIRIWYDDPSLVAMYYSAYTPRAPHDSMGADYFFRFDTVQVLVEVRQGPEPLRTAIQQNPDWQRDHDVLASLFIHAGNVRAAAGEYAKLARAFPNRPDYSLYAGAAYEAMGRAAEARDFYRAAARSYGDTLVRERATALLRALPSSVP